MLAAGALFFDCHLHLCFRLLLLLARNVLPHPVSLFVDFHVRLDGAADKLLEAQFLLAGGARDLSQEAV